jgi:hypothetical protein
MNPPLFSLSRTTFPSPPLSAANCKRKRRPPIARLSISVRARPRAGVPTAKPVRRLAHRVTQKSRIRDAPHQPTENATSPPPPQQRRHSRLGVRIARLRAAAASSQKDPRHQSGASARSSDLGRMWIPPLSAELWRKEIHARPGFTMCPTQTSKARLSLRPT